jgi:nucleoside-diphosphate-sugar epimerase
MGDEPVTNAALNHPRSRLLVVGGSGFIGRHVTAEGVARGWSVTTLGLHSEPVGPGIPHLRADMADKGKLLEALGASTFHYVVNCGGYVDHTHFVDGGEKVFETHFRGVVNLVGLLDRRVLRGMVNLGSSDEYGNSPAPQHEAQREAPISPYSFGKLATTHFLQTLHRTENFPAATLRLFLTYGPGQNSRRFLPQIIRGCLAGNEFAASAGDQVRDFCYVKDVVKAIFAALTDPMARGQVINIGSGIPVKIREVIENIRSIVGKGKADFGRIPYRVGENMALYPDISKARTVLRWTPETGLDTGLRLTIDSFRNHA